MSEILLAVVLGGSLWIWISTVLKASTVSTVLSVKIQISTIYKEFLEKKIDQKKLGINVDPNYLNERDIGRKACTK